MLLLPREGKGSEGQARPPSLGHGLRLNQKACTVEFSQVSFDIRLYAFNGLTPTLCDVRCDLSSCAPAIAQLSGGQPGCVDNHPARDSGVEKQVVGTVSLHVDVRGNGRGRLACFQVSVHVGGDINRDESRHVPGIL